MSFIVLEGGEGAGKGSILKALAAELRARGCDPVVTREPGGAPETENIRALLVDERTADWDPLCELMLLMADRAQHVARVIKPALAKGRHVVCDRFEASTYAYQGAGKGIDAGIIASLQKLAAADIAPDLTILLDVDPTTGLARSARRLRCAGSREGRFEALDIEFHRRVRDSFRQQASRAPDRWIVVDANRPLDLVQEEAVARTIERISALGWNGA